jgi:C1A family cysteine protease
MTEKELDSILKEIQRIPTRWQPRLTKIAIKLPEDRKRLLGVRPDRDMLTRIRQLKLDTPIRRVHRLNRAKRETDSENWDWRNEQGRDWTTPIRDQGDCGSCVAFGVLGTIESRQKIHVHRSHAAAPNLSEAHLFFCGCGRCCNIGWNVSPALNYLQGHGVPPETCFSYRDSNMTCSQTCYDWRSRAEPNRIESWNHTYDVAMMKRWLKSEGPLVGVMAVYTDFYYYAGGIYEYVWGSLEGYHCIAVVGFSDDQEYWICKNSWGTDWGERGGEGNMRGWFRIDYGESGLEGFGMWSPILPVMIVVPQLHALVY